MKTNDSESQLLPELSFMPSRLLDDLRAILRDAPGRACTAANAAMVDR